jgi:hypothetical protein
MQWFKAVILATQEVEIWRNTVQGQPWQEVYVRNCLTKTKPNVEKKDLLKYRLLGCFLGIRVQQLGWNG